MINRLIRSASFGSTFALSTLFGHNMKPVGKMPVWLEGILRFLAAAAVFCLVSTVLDSFHSKQSRFEENC